MDVSQGDSGQPEHGRIMEEKGKLKVTNGKEKRTGREETLKDSSPTTEEWTMRALLVFQTCLGDPENPRQPTEPDWQKEVFFKTGNLD